MGLYNAANNAETKLTIGCTPASLTITVENASVFPETPFMITVEEEIMEVTSVNVNIMSVKRGREGTAPASHVAGTEVENNLTAGMWNGLQDFIEGNGKFEVAPISGLLASSSEDGNTINLSWINPTNSEFKRVEVYASETDIINADLETVKANAELIVTSATAKAHAYPSSHGRLVHFKAYAFHEVAGVEYHSDSLAASCLTQDRLPAGPVTSLLVREDDSAITLTWKNPTDVDFSKVKVVYNTTAYPTSPTDGTLAYEGSGETVEITGLVNDTMYYFRAFTVDVAGNVNSHISMQIQAAPAAVKIYGVKIDETNSNPLTAVTYTNHALGMTGGSVAWDSVYPFNQIRPVMFKAGAVNYELDKNDFSKKKDGSPADITTGADGDVMIEFPKIWWKFERVGTDLFVKYATKQIDSAWKCWGHTKGAVEKDKVYIGAYLGFESASKLRSLSGKAPTVNKTIGQFRTLAEANGAGYQQMGYFQLLMLQILYLIRFKSLDSQTALGRGFVDGNSAAISTGGTNAKSMNFGELTGKQQMKFSGIEDFWGNCNYWIDGLVSNSTRNILIGTQNFNNTGANYSNYGQGSIINIGGYIDSVQGGSETGFITKSSKGSTATYYGDAGHLSATSVPFFGGYWGVASDSGVFSLFLNSVADNPWIYFASRLTFV